MPGIREVQQVLALPSLQRLPEQEGETSMTRTFAELRCTTAVTEEIRTAGPEGPGAPTSPSLPGAPCEQKRYPNRSSAVSTLRSSIFILRSYFSTYNGAGGASCTSLASLTGLALSGGTPEPGFTPNAEVPDYRFVTLIAAVHSQQHPWVRGIP